MAGQTSAGCRTTGPPCCRHHGHGAFRVGHLHDLRWTRCLRTVPGMRCGSRRGRRARRQWRHGGPGRVRRMARTNVILHRARAPWPLRKAGAAPGSRPRARRGCRARVEAVISRRAGAIRGPSCCAGAEPAILAGDSYGKAQHAPRLRRLGGDVVGGSEAGQGQPQEQRSRDDRARLHGGGLLWRQGFRGRITTRRSTGASFRPRAWAAERSGGRP
jgi:hypothetical protein